ncbi:MAG: 1-(5-phosphoribosyl)-5-[(5-phosphoribosylamino)methylideneamino]imidazole-4-carboxamide isomerase [Candidatus Brocadiae bacterium]|nr:1-(5-phosphoribosyl)-5-[(5-phosphoribosylamino)methylideneamino]imidazole-4-carboxamide isomerase [Candidatus Brocadiia bacterium]
MLIYPAVDIARGRCVRLLQGKPERETVYYERPAEAARHWEQLGAEVLHVVDLDGALTAAMGGAADAGGAAGRSDSPNVGVVREILAEVDIPVQVAGGLRTTEAVRRVLEGGAARAVLGTRAVKDPEWAGRLCKELPERIVIAVDALEGRVAVEGWQEFIGTGPVELARRLAEDGPAAFLYTDVSRDGMLSRPNFEAVEALLAAVGIPVIASGGVASLDDIRRLGECGADAVIVGKALYEERFALREALDVACAYASRLSPALGAG